MTERRVRWPMLLDQSGAEDGMADNREICRLAYGVDDYYVASSQLLGARDGGTTRDEEHLRCFECREPDRSRDALKGRQAYFQCVGEVPC
jgi:hypothetical protein